MHLVWRVWFWSNLTAAREGKILLSNGLNVVFISCLLPRYCVSPIYEFLLKRSQENGKKWHILGRMNAPVSRLDFLSVLPSFVEDQLQNTKQAIYLLIDEFDDTMEMT